MIFTLELAVVKAGILSGDRNHYFPACISSPLGRLEIPHLLWLVSLIPLFIKPGFLRVLYAIAIYICSAGILACFFFFFSSRASLRISMGTWFCGFEIFFNFFLPMTVKLDGC